MEVSVDEGARYQEGLIYAIELAEHVVRVVTVYHRVHQETKQYVLVTII